MPRLLLVLLGCALIPTPGIGQDFRPIPLQSQITRVQPWTGLVLWDTSESVKTDAVSLEFRYFAYSEIVTAKDTFDWSPVERFLAGAAARGHQGVLRFYFDYPGKPSGAPKYLNDLPDYRPITGKSEGKRTGFADWSHPELKRMTLDFYTQFARKFDRDPRLAYLETGFGLWAEYHIYDGPMKLGQTFPDKAFQRDFFKHLSNQFERTPWLMSIDVAAEARTPLAEESELLNLPFGQFDDSFLGKDHAKWNAKNWKFLGLDRWKTQPRGGEFSYYSDHDQKMALAPNGPHGIAFETLAREYHLSFIIANDQPKYQPLSRIAEAGKALGYRLQVTQFASNGTHARVEITNTGIAPPFHDAYVALDGVRAKQSLRGLLPGEKRTYVLRTTSAAPKLTIESDRLVPGQRIEFQADLPGQQ
ncbi:DUF4832 domain-containing protein [Tuwongella immobilis]|uniref:Secreted protein: Uncharacterized protein n=1 Tax=Tuwongella immobilis TaxID=692036 RepID=A0A6C2YJR0_9BACT|nr:DUF4832 domain-containing protein [Tuwongella immobilis]VIP01808.1 secreted protein : Uncharacterized protein OS=Singulisphaera acidiphila (strain ATCC BAA-1392 / DSM 18658 / VKM B-2454 / MOB10) GN=Sinac_6695 PE=4 SV=1 [Tuwongella immobilis]VTR99513.1 secreted protein : Uncharacterized protein OS=Singulisphaera acidiphila (strain ATCC BAA-1392 / DSM 18658 / VKM B-2454 / MOB10) GN=Sinac_6695 PE=4 SV=1 [Tuwongella immobilis]